jgi:TolB-like protein
MKFFDELKRRNVIKETIAYIVVAWVFLQVTTAVLTIFEAPSWVSKTLTFIIAMGLPVWIFFSWAYQVTPEGFKKTGKISEDQFITVASNKRLDILIVISLMAAIAVTFINKPSIGIGSRSIVEKDLVPYQSIAVLPFTDYSPSKDQAYITDGMAKNLIQELGKISLLTVPSATTMKTYKETDKTLPEIARELNVDVLVEGSTERRNDRMRITTSLISADDKTLWTQDYDVSMKEFNVIGYNISQKIVKELKLVLTPEDSARFTMPALVNPDALEADLKGMQIIMEGQSFEDVKLAGQFFQKAITLDSTYARSYAHLGFIYNLYPYFSEKSPIEAAKMSEALNNIALRLDPQLTLAYLNQFNNLYFTEWKWEEALPILSKAESLSLNDPEVLDLFIEYYVTSGKFDKAFNTLEKLGQKKEFRDWYFSNKVYIQFHSRNLEGAIRTGEEFQSLNSEELPSPTLHMWSLSLLGRHEEAVSLARKILTNDAHLVPIQRGGIGCVLARAGLKKEALEQLGILKNSGLKYIDPISIGLLYMGLGDNDLAMQYFEQGYETHARWIIYLKRGPPFDMMRGDPRFEKLIQTLKFP